jgi:cardiolipin synthase
MARFGELRFGKLTRFYKRNHRRAIVIDGVVAFAGGIAVGDKWLGSAQDADHWRDSMVKVTGAPAAAVQSAFVPLWAQTTGELLAGGDFFPEAAPALPPLLHVGIASSPGGDDHPLRLLFAQSIAAARRHVYIQTPYFVPDAPLQELLERRARAGVDVRLLVPDDHTDAKPVRLASQGRYEGLLESGVRVFEYQGTMMHRKAMVVDGLWSVVGSANMDVRALEFDRDNVLGILDGVFARRQGEIFLADASRAREVRLEPWRRRGALHKALERAAATFEQFY